MSGPTKVAVEFTRPAPSFWRIAYPPADWTASIVWYFFPNLRARCINVKKTVTGKFQFRDLVYNINTKEDGAVRRVYETRGITMYEVAVPIQGDAWASGHNISDWTEDVLQLSNNEHLKSSTFRVLSSDMFR